MSPLSGLSSQLGVSTASLPKLPPKPSSPTASSSSSSSSSSFKPPKAPSMGGGSSGGSSSGDSSLEPSSAVGVTRWFNILAILMVIAVLTMAITQQVGYGMPPSELGILQRSALVGACLAPILNLLTGMRPQHYALALIASTVGILASGKEIIQHTNGTLTVDPNEIVFGRPFYEWDFGICIIIILGAALMLLWVKSWMALDYGLVHHWGPSRTWAFASIIWLAFYVLFTIGQIFVQCGDWSCPADPSSSGSLGWVFTLSVSDTAGKEASISIPGFITVMIGIGLLSLIIGAALNHKMTSQVDGTSSTAPAS